MDIDQNAMAEPVYSKKSAAEAASITEAMKDNFLFQHLSPVQREEIVGIMVKVSVKKDEWVITQGDQGDRFYIVDSGRYEVRLRHFWYTLYFK